MTRGGSRWKDLPERFGKVGTVKRRYYDWIARGVLADILAVLAQEADLEWVCVDASPASTSSARARIGRSGWSAGTRSSRRTELTRRSDRSSRPRIGQTPSRQ